MFCILTFDNGILDYIIVLLYVIVRNQHQRSQNTLIDDIKSWIMSHGIEKILSKFSLGMQSIFLEEFL